jgi:RNA polymerase sigma factor (sigma-70 family)
VNPSDKFVEENDLWAAFKAGDRLAFDTILHQYYSVLLKYGIRILGSMQTELVEDTLQDFFVDLYTARERLGDAISLKAYLLSSFKRRLFKEKEKSNRFIKENDFEGNYDFKVQFSIENTIVEGESEIEMRKKLQFLMTQLSARQKEAVYLRFFEKMEYPEIAEAMNINHHSVVNLVYGGVKLMRENWFEYLICLLILESQNLL